MAPPEATDTSIPRPWRVVSRRQELRDAVSIRITPLDGVCPPFAPGQFNMLYVFGVGDVAISISGGVDGCFVHTVRAVGAISSALAALQPGAVLGLRGPFGRGWPVAATGGDVVIIAGGLGLAPLRPAIEAVRAQRERHGRMVLLLGARTQADIVFPDTLAQWGRAADVEMLVSVDRADASWRGHVGVVPSLVPRATFDAANAVAMVCGPEVMMRFSANALRAAGMPDSRIHLSMERNMKCAVGLCGHCQFGADFVCRNGPVFRLDAIASRLAVREL